MSYSFWGMNEQRVALPKESENPVGYSFWSVNALAERSHSNAVKHGFWRNQDPTEPLVCLAKLALVTSEIGEAIQAVRTPGGNLGEELADIVIRVFDLAEACDINLEQEIHDKMTKNEARPMMHGKLA